MISMIRIAAQLCPPVESWLPPDPRSSSASESQLLSQPIPRDGLSLCHQQSLRRRRHGLLERGHLLVADDHLVGDLPGVHDEPRLGADEVLVVGELVGLEVLGQHLGDGGRALVDVRLELLRLGQLLRELLPLRRELLLK